MFRFVPPTVRPASKNVLPQDRQLALRLVCMEDGPLRQQLQRLRDLPAHGNRRLRYHHLFLGLLLAFFDPLTRSLRLIEDQGDFDAKLDLPRLARSTTADALRVFDPTHLQPLIEQLRQRVPDLQCRDQDLGGIVRRIIAADGTYLTTLADVAWALHHTKSNGKTQGQVRLNVQMDVDNWCPQVLSVSGDDGSEPSAFMKDLLSGVLYVMDRNFLDFDFLGTLLAKDNDFVLRVRANAPSMQVMQALPLGPADLEAGVVSDQIVRLTGRGAPQGLFRLVTIQSTDRRGKPETILLLSNLTDPQVAAHVIGSIYRLRWQIELFFKWLKTWARLDHLLSTSRNGITFQFYVAVIGVLMMYLQSGKRISVYALAALGRLARGQCTLDQAMEIIARRDREAQMNRARQQRRRARKKLA
jgi:Transposase DDE domain